MKISYGAILQHIRDLGDALLKWFSILAICIGGWWTWHLFKISDTDASNIEVTISTETKPYSEDKRLLFVDVQPKNIGKIPVAPGKAGLVLTLRNIPANLKAGHIDEENLTVFQRINISAEYDDGYFLEPGVSYHEAHVFVVPKDSNYLINADFDLGPDEDGADTEVDTSVLASAH